MIFLTIVLALIFFLNLIIYGLRIFSCKRKNLPPGPIPLPIIGNLHLLGVQPHKSMTQLAKTHGPIMLLRLGFKNTVVISSAAMAKEILQKQDFQFSNRNVPNAMHAHDHFKYSVIWLPVGSRWRSLPKILNTNIFSASCLDANQLLRHKKMEELVEFCRKSCHKGEAVDLGLAAFRTSLNMMSTTILSKDWEDPLSDSGKQMKDLLEKTTLEMGKPNLVDLFPFLEKFDPQGIQRRTAAYIAEMVEFLTALIDERVEKRKYRIGEGNDMDVLDVLLTIIKESPEEIDRTHIQILCMDLIGAGTDTTSSTLEWAMAEVLRNPEIMRKIKDELDQVTGRGKILKEVDVAFLPYLRSVVKETLRLHPPTPLLIPRKVEHDVKVYGYTVPKDSQVLVNAWAIGRDADTWTSPLKFKPERFLDPEMDVRGRDFESIPFGAGRRICPGLPLVVRVLPVMLGSLLNSFHWNLEGGISPGELNMEEKFGITLKKAHPLRAIPDPI